MDTGLGKLEPISRERANCMLTKTIDGIFIVGEILTIKGSKFKVQSMNRKGMKLKILPRDK